MTTWYLIGLGALGVAAVWLYNRVIALRHRARAAWSDIDVQLKRRWDLVPLLTDAVKGYMQYEASTFEKVVEARSRAMTAAETGSPAAQGRNEHELATATQGLVALVEEYPDLKTNERVLELQKSLVQIEDTLQHARRYYNAVVRDHNITIASFPTVAIASLFRFRSLEFFQIEGEERSAPSVDV